MTGMRKAALAAITVLVAAATSASFAESYRALYEWAARHGLHGVWAAAWPLQVDVFVAVGELALFVALADSWPVRSRASAWAVTLIGLGVSVAGNVGHVTSHDWTSQITASVPPLAAAAALAVGLGVLKRVVAVREARPAGGSDGASLTATVSAPASRRDAGAVARHDALALPSGDAPKTRKSRATRKAAGRVSVADMEARALGELARQPDLSGAELGRLVGASPRTGQRLLSRLSANGAHAPAPREGESQ